MYEYPTQDEMYRSRHLIQDINLIVAPEIMGESRQHAYIQTHWNLPAWRNMSPKQRRQILHQVSAACYSHSLTTFLQSNIAVFCLKF